MKKNVPSGAYMRAYDFLKFPEDYEQAGMENILHYYMPALVYVQALGDLMIACLSSW